MNLKAIADKRHQIHENHASSRPLSDDYNLVGISGEWAFAHFSGMMPDLEEKPEGDKGIDFSLPVRLTIDVKTARKAYHLIQEVGKPVRADIYVLAQYDDATGKSELIGWEWAHILLQAPAKDFGYGIVNHYIHRNELRPMDDLKKMMI